jgi:serine/threonine-protein kinase RsbW
MDTTTIQIEVIVPTQTKYLDLIGSIGERVAKELKNYSGDQAQLAYQLNLVLTEATVNVIKHANALMSEQTVRINLHIQNDVLTIKVYDHGQGFDLEAIPLPDFEHPREGGLGLFLIRSIMDSVTYTQHSNCNVLTMTKNLPVILDNTPDNYGSSH